MALSGREHWLFCCCCWFVWRPYLAFCSDSIPVEEDSPSAVRQRSLILKRTNRWRDRCHILKRHAPNGARGCKRGRHAAQLCGDLITPSRTSCLLPAKQIVRSLQHAADHTLSFSYKHTFSGSAVQRDLVYI